jgi:hypothetical protein
VSIVARGLGQPESPLVTQGLGQTEPAAPGAMAALLAGAGSLTGTLTADQPTEPPPTVTGGGFVGRITLLEHTTVDMAALLTGTGTLTGTLEAFDWSPIYDEMNNALILELV